MILLQDKLIKLILLIFFCTFPLKADQLYNKKDYNVWKSYKCNTRDLLLIKENLNLQIQRNICDIKEGNWFVKYSNEFINDSSLIDVDHIIPLRYAHEAGGFNWSKRKKEIFANDLENLVISSRKDNRTKKDSGPSEWMPEYNRCLYVFKWKKITEKYELKIKPIDSYTIENIIKKECQ
jgi:hypothetical protein